MAASDVTTLEKVEFLRALIEHAMAERAALPDRYPHRQKRRELRDQIEQLFTQYDLHAALLGIEQADPPAAV